MSARRTRPSAATTSGSRSGTQARRTDPARRDTRTRTAVIAGAALLLGAGGALGISAIADRPDDAESTITALQEAEAQRDAEVTEDLTAIARQVAEDLEPALVGLGTALPPEEGAPSGPLVPAAEVDAWTTSVDSALAAFGDSPSAGTAVNFARNSLIAAVEQFRAVVSTYAAALAAEDEAQQQRLVEIAREQRSTAVFTWSIAASQLDFVNVEAGLGHAHVELPGTPGSGAGLDGGAEGNH